MGFRAFLVMDNKVARQAMAENGGKWSKMVENGRKKVHRGYLVGNGLRALFGLGLGLGLTNKQTNKLLTCRRS